MGTAVNIIEGSHVWVGDPLLAWVDGQVLNITGEVAEILTNEGEMVISNISDLYPKDMEAPPGGVDDMTKLSYLHEPGVLQNLATRYELNQIYTYTGDILIAINPFQELSHLYDSHVMEHYKGAQFGKLSPHVFAIADVAYRDMIEEGKSNSILVSGESGAGKTETTKMIMQYLAYLGGHDFTGRPTVERQVLESNPVLEAFGNAKTVRNNNSSRFGKFVEIQFDKHGRISGAAIRTYLLERSRVCQISEAERNYHCFYLLCAAPPEEIETYKLGDPKSFHYLNQSNCYDRAGASDAHDYLATRRAMDIVGISKSEQDAIFRVVAAILHLGNIDFATDGDFDSSVVNDESWLHLYMTAELLMCDPYALQDGLCKRVMITPEEVIRRSLDPVGATVNRDGLAKTIYSRLFDWLVEKINMSIGQDPNSKSSIGVLDIYGFESFETNSFEQFCINYTNEKLQQHFNQHVFKMEQEEYIKDEINWSYIDFVDNKDVLSLIDKKPGGIISLLDEACLFPKSTAETFSQKLYQTFKDHKRFIKPKLARTGFTVAHYAGEVEYQSDQFLDKNKDYVVPEHQDLLSAAKCDFVASLFPPLLEETTKTSKFSSIGSQFKLQLHQLLDTLNSTEPHYVRCVKPNNHLKPSIFENINVMQQLRSGGVLEAIRISCAGYPTRRSFSEFLYRFGMLAPEVLENGYDEKVACKRILDKFGLIGCQIGKTKIFLRSGQMAELDARRALARNNAAYAIQRHVRTQISRKEFIATRKASIHLQALWRRKMACKLYKDMSRTVAAVKIQKKMCRYLAIKDYERLKFSSLILQTGLRTMAACNELNYRKTTKAATLIQASWRGHRDFSGYKKFKTASKITQCRWRGRMAQKKLETDLRTTAAYNDLNYRKTNEAATLIQASWRGHRDFSYYKKFKAASKITQLRWRGKTARKEHKKIETDLRRTVAYNELNYTKTSEAATLIQASWRGHRDFSYYKKVKAVSKITQFRWRGKIARKEHKKIEDVTGSEAKNDPKMMEQDNQLRAHLDEIKDQDIKELDYSFQARQNSVHDTLFVKKHQVAHKASDASAPIVSFPQVHLQEYKRIELLTSEVETLKALLQSEKQRSDAMEKRCLETLVRSERREKKLEETGRRVHQLQEYLNRMMYCMSNQVADLKMVVHASLSSSSSSSSSTESMAKYDPVESICTSSSDATSTSSDFTFPAPSPSHGTFSTVSDAFQLVVHDLSAPEISEFDKWGPDREQGFEDFF